tara:strand:+ start:36771 stop:38312 length:1542 start_codon:yes stop_codon:yes gene_type:complete
MKIDKNKNYIFCGDNLDWLQQVPDESVDLCYIDPPFFSNRNYEVIWGNGYELRSFGDRFAGGIGHYIEWMRPRIELIHSKLKKTGSIFLHCDWHASHKLRCVLDDIFDESNFRNEIIWKRKNGSNSTEEAPRTMANATDTIFFYSKTKEYFFKLPYAAYEEAYIEKTYKSKDSNGDRYTSSDLRSPSPRPNLVYNYKGYKPHPNGWSVELEKMKEFDRLGLLLFPKDKNGRIRKKNYLKDRKGVPLTNQWSDIPFLQEKSPEKLGYPTQKPEALIRRIIETGSKKGDVVLDCFGGGGTTAKVCADLGRTFITGDVSPVAVKIMSERLLFDCEGIKFETKNLPQSEKELKNLNGHLFAEIVCEVMGWEVNEKKSGDGGIDGWTSEGLPIQIKNHNTTAAGRPDIQKFFGALAKEKKKTGIFVAWRFAGEAYEYIADMKRDHKIEIKAIECSKIFGGLLLDSSKSKEIDELYLERRPKAWASNQAKAEAHRKTVEKINDAKNKTKRKKKSDAEVS